MCRIGTRLALIVTVGLLAVTCRRGPSGLPTGPQAGITGLTELSWPQPPQRPRVRFVMAIARPEDVGIRPSFWKRLGQFIAGKRDESFVRPTGVAVSGSVIYVADPGAQALRILDTEAGRAQSIHEVDGQQLVSPVAVAVGGNDRVYLADSYLATVFVVDGGGSSRTTIARAEFRSPAGLAYDGNRDRLYVADSGAHRIWVFDGDGTPAGSIGQRGTGNGEFNFPSHVAVDRDGTLYVTDALNFRLQMFNADLSFAAQFGYHGDSSGEFAMPKGVGVDSEGHIYVVETLFDAVQIFDGDGRYLLTFGDRGVKPGQFWLPSGLFIDGRDRIYVADAYNQRLQIFQYLGGETDE